jgi:pimeloyl-ACP methyl ester carboxylesterase
MTVAPGGSTIDATTDLVDVETNGIRLQALVRGSGPLVILLHGFPQTWYLWRNQIDPLVAAGFRVCVPDQRGYGASEAPERIEAYNMLELTADVIGLADGLGEQQFYLVGHDFGAIVSWHVALQYPHRLHGVIGFSVPYNPAFLRSTAAERGSLGTFFYQHYFNSPGVAEEELERDVGRSLRWLYYSVSAEGWRFASQVVAGGPEDRELLGLVGDPPESFRGFTSEDICYYVSQFRHSGFRGPLSWYRNRPLIGLLTPWLQGAKIRVPSYFFYGEFEAAMRDSFGVYDEARSAPETHFEDLRAIKEIPGAAHWIPCEQPGLVTNAICDSLLDLVEHDGAPGDAMKLRAVHDPK